jgi:hypothetical protein
MYLQQCFDAPEIFAPVLALFVTIGDKRPDVIVATPECFLAPFSCLFAPEFDAGSDDWKTVVETTAEFQRRIFTTTGDSWRARFRGVVELFGAGDEHAEGYRLAITADPIDHVAVRAVLNAFRFTRDTAFWA